MTPEQLNILNSGAQPHFDYLKVTPDLASLPELGLDFYASVRLASSIGRTEGVLKIS